MRAKTHVAQLALLCLATACSRPAMSDDTERVRTQLDSALAVHARHFHEGDIDGLVDGYTDSVVVRPANMEPVKGSDALRTTLTAWLKAAPLKSVEYTTEDLVVHGPQAFHIVSYRAVVVPSGAGEVNDHGTCVLFWVREPSGRWRINRSTCNSSVPAPQPAAEPARRQ